MCDLEFDGEDSFEKTTFKFELELNASNYNCLLRHSVIWTVLYCIAYVIDFIFGLIGNLSVLLIVRSIKSSKGSLQSVSNKVFYAFVTNLAFADLLVIIFCLIPTLIGNVFRPWILGLFVCKAVPYLQGVSVTASVYTLVAISIDRFLGIYFPLNNWFSIYYCRVVISAIWGFSFSIALPWLIYFDLVPMYENSDFQMCTEVWPSEDSMKLYFIIVNLGFQYLLPLSVIAIFYIMLMAKIWSRKTHKMDRINSEPLRRLNARVIDQSKIKVLKMLMAVVSVFALSWLPLYAIFARIKLGPNFDEDDFEGELIVTITPIAQWLGASTSCVNPILYFFFNSKFRKCLKQHIEKYWRICSSKKQTVVTESVAV